MSETFSVKAILSAEDGSFRSVFGNAQSILQTFSNSTSGLTGGLSGVMNMVKSGLGFGVLQGIGQQAFNTVAGAVSGMTSNLGDAISRYDTLQNIPKMMDMLGFDGAEKATNKLKDAIDGLPTSLDAITANAQNIALVTGNLDTATDTAIALNNAFLMSGASSDEASRGTTQFVQMLSTGKVDMQSWTSLIQNGMGPALTKVAESFGYTGESAKTELYAALQDGRITFTEFNNRLIEMNGEVDISGAKFAGFAKLAKANSTGIETSITNVKTAVVKGLADMVEATDKRLRESGESISGYFDSLKQTIGNTFKTIASSDVFQSLIDSAKKTVDAMSDAFNRFAQSPAMKAVHDNLDIVAHNLGVILPNVIKALEPVMEAVAKVATGILAAISDTIARVTSSRAFMIFCENIGKAVNAVGSIVEKVIRASSKYFEAILSAANEVMTAFGKTFNAIKNTAEQTDTAGKLFGNFQKVLDLVKSALIKVAEFLEKHHTWILKIIEHLPQIIALMAAVKVALLVIEKIKAFKNLIDQVVSFGKSMKDAVSNVGSFVSTLVSKFTGGAQGAVTQMSGMEYAINGAFTKISSSAGLTGGSISSSIGGGFGGAAGAATSAGSSILGVIGGIAAGVGAAVGIIAGIVSAITKWREEQKKIGEEMVEFTEAQQAVIDKNKELADAYNTYKDSLVEKATQSEAEIGLVANLREEYNKLLDANGEVIKGKEDLAAAIQDKIFQAMGIEKGQIDDLRNEYISLIDQNGDIKQGYEDRAAAIEQALSEILGHEISGKDQVLAINDELMSSIDQIIEKKRLEAQTEMLQDAVIEAQKKRKEFNDQRLETLDLIAQKQKDLAAIENGTFEQEFANDTQRQAAKDKIKSEIEELTEQEKKLSGQIIQTQSDEAIATDGVTKALEEQLDTTGEFAGQTQLYWERYIGDVTSAEEAVRKHGTAAREVLEQQVVDAQEKYEEIKAAHEAGNEAITETQIAAAEKELEFAKQQRQQLLENKALGYAEELQAQIEADDEEIAELTKHVQEVSKMRQDQNAGILAQEQKKLEDLKAKREQDQQEYNQYMTNLNTIGSEKLGQLTQTTNTESQNASNALTNNTRIGVDNGIREWERLAIGIPRTYAPVQSETQTITANACNGVQSTVANSQSGITAATAAVENGIVNEMSKAQRELPSAIGAAMSSGQSAISNKQADFGSASSAATNAIVRPFGSVGNELSAKTSTAMNAAGKQIQASTTILGNYAAHLVTGIVRNFGGLSSSLYAVGSNAMIGLQNGLNARAGSVYNIASAIANNVARIMQAALQINSPSRLTRWMGRMIDEGLVLGLKDEAAKTESMAARVAENVSESMNKSMQEVVIPFPDMGEVNRQMARMTNGGRYVLNSDYNYNGAFQATIEVPVNLNGREVSRITVDTDSQEQYYNQKRFYR